MSLRGIGTFLGLALLLGTSSATAQTGITASGTVGVGTGTYAQPPPPLPPPPPPTWQDHRSSGRLYLPYDEGQAIPPGYHVYEKTRTGLIIGGAVTLGAMWLMSSFVAASVGTAARGESVAWPLYVPVVGPFIMMGTSNSNELVNFVLAVDGLAQVAGTVMLIVGLSYPKMVLRRNDVAASSGITVIPARFGRDGSGLSIVGTF